ncbi:MAG TPA: aspartate dehydrogenase [Nitrososphaera sp.]|nr:aspartate dehydrogenase [Nitrososphaera sp.]
MPKKTVGLVGCGTIGTDLALAIESGSIRNARLGALFDAIDGNITGLRAKLKTEVRAYHDFDEFIGSKIDIVIEAASQQAVRKFGKLIIESGKDLMVMSVGALTDRRFLAELLDLAPLRNGQNRIYIPTGAIAGIDAIRSVRHLIDSVTLTTTKGPKALAGAPFFATSKVNLDTVTSITEIYKGSAAQAVKLFPANVNVAAVLSLAGIGAERTTVRVLVDPHATTNQHDITATGSFGDIKITVNNVTAPGNPKTSFLAVLSAIECLRSICDEGIRVGS